MPCCVRGPGVGLTEVTCFFQQSNGRACASVLESRPPCGNASHAKSGTCLAASHHGQVAEARQGRIYADMTYQVGSFDVTEATV